MLTWIKAKMEDIIAPYLFFYCGMAYQRNIQHCDPVKKEGGFFLSFVFNSPKVNIGCEDPRYSGTKQSMRLNTWPFVSAGKSSSDR